MRHSRTGFSNTRQHKTKQIHCPETTGLLTHLGIAREINELEPPILALTDFVGTVEGHLLQGLHHCCPLPDLLVLPPPWRYRQGACRPPGLRDTAPVVQP